MNYNDESNIFFVLLILVAVLTIFYIITSVTTNCNSRNNKENWINYKESYGKINEASSYPINFYKYNYYRQPYRWPLGIRTNNPITHISPILDKLQN